MVYYNYYYYVCIHCVIGEKTFKNILIEPGKFPGLLRNGPLVTSFPTLRKVTPFGQNLPSQHTSGFATFAMFLVFVVLVCRCRSYLTQLSLVLFPQNYNFLQNSSFICNMLCHPEEDPIPIWCSFSFSAVLIPIGIFCEFLKDFARIP